MKLSRSESAPARCAGCGTRSEVRQLGETPSGWSRGRDYPGSSSQGHYWCPSCSLSLSPAPEQETPNGCADSRPEVEKL